MENCFENINDIKQVFILIHNVYFNKEVTYRYRQGKRKYETYWIVRKLNNQSYINDFDREDKIIEKSLIAYINDGSHSIGDDFSISIGTEEIQKYLLAFEKIFDKSGDINHYNIMRSIEG